jgi:hypothetical protein
MAKNERERAEWQRRKGNYEGAVNSNKGKPPEKREDTSKAWKEFQAVGGLRNPPSSDVFIGAAVAALSTLAIGLGGAEARAATPASLQQTGVEQANVATRNIPEKPTTLLVDLSKQPLRKAAK